MIVTETQLRIEIERANKRFWSKVDKPDENGCWNWLASTSNGHAAFICKPLGITTGARFAYYWLYGSIPYGLDIDHLCNNGKCVNPLHLEAITRAENIRRKYERGYRRSKW